MIKPGDRLSIQCLPLDAIQVKEYQERYPERLQHYIQLMKQYPRDYAGLLFVVPSDTHPGMFALLDGHHKFCAAVMCGRPDAMCVVINSVKESR